MLPIVAMSGVAFLAGATVAIVMTRAPAIDLGAPRISINLLRREIHLHPRLARLLQRRLDPAAATGLLLTVGLAVAVLAWAAIGLLLLMVRQRAGLARSDIPLAQWAADHATPQSTDMLRIISLLGGTTAVVAVSVAVAALELRRTRRWAIPWLLIVTVGGQFAMVNLVKILVARARPDLLQLSGFAGPSFPSGHAAAAAATYGCAALALGRGRPRWIRCLLASMAAAITVAVSSTRVLLGVHWFTDVLAGVAFGWGWFALCSIAFGGRALRFGRPVATAEQLAETAPASAARHPMKRRRR